MLGNLRSVRCDLLDLSAGELDDLFRRSPAGPIPDGETEGTAIVFPGTVLAGLAARLGRLTVWKGKRFDGDGGALWNLVTPFGVEAVKAKVAYGESWFDGQECIVIDYSKTSLIARRVRDEIRLAAPGVYLGLVFWARTRVGYFALRKA